MNRKEAIDIAIELWEWMAETGAEDKHEWPSWGRHGGAMYLSCPLCEYSYRSIYGTPHIPGLCEPCPYYKRFGRCYKPNSPFYHWRSCVGEAGQKRNAKKFLEQLYVLRKEEA